MGYNFLLTRLPCGSDHFPIDLPADFYPSAKTFSDLNAIRDTLVLQKGYKADDLSAEDEVECWWQTPDGGLLSLTLRGDSIYVDTHAGWQYVLETYRCLKALYPDLVLLDPQKMTIHDEASYSAFVRESYAALEQRRNT
jgi:hypothetical protein